MGPIALPAISAPLYLPAAAAAASPSVPAQLTAPAPDTANTTLEQNPQPDPQPDPIQKYSRAMEQAAQAAANYYALGDTKFSLFKDATGQVITRYVSLLDGRVTYVPQPQLLVNHNSGTGTLSLQA